MNYGTTEQRTTLPCVDVHGDGGVLLDKLFFESRLLHFLDPGYLQRIVTYSYFVMVAL